MLFAKILKGIKEEKRKNGGMAVPAKVEWFPAGFISAKCNFFIMLKWMGNKVGRGNKRSNTCMCDYKLTHLSYGKPWWCTLNGLLYWLSNWLNVRHHKATHDGGYYCTVQRERLLRTAGLPICNWECVSSSRVENTWCKYSVFPNDATRWKPVNDYRVNFVWEILLQLQFTTLTMKQLH